jgi:hypothetical protein
MIQRMQRDRSDSTHVPNLNVDLVPEQCDVGHVASSIPLDELASPV